MRTSTLALAGAVFLGLQTAAMAAEGIMTCTVTHKYACGDKGCTSGDPTIVIRIDFDRSIYSRCDAKGCDDFDAVITRSGIFVNVALPNRGAMAKLSEDGSNFTEVVTVMTTPVISLGYCR